MATSAPEWSEEVTLRDGTEVQLRPVRPDDAPRLRALFHRLSPESIYLRFLDARKDLTLDQARDFATVDYHHSMAIVAVVGEGDETSIIGVARYGEDPSRPEAGADTAVVVEDSFQGRGLGTILLLRLVAYARDRGIKSLRASVHTSNAQIMRFVRRSGLPTRKKLEEGIWDIILDLDSGQLPDLGFD